MLWEASEGPKLILLEMGSEMHVAWEAWEELERQGVNAKVVSLPSWVLFEERPEEYREQMLPNGIRAQVAIEAARQLGWKQYVGLDGSVVGLPHFGASAPAGELYRRFGLTAEREVEEPLKLLRGVRA